MTENDHASFVFQLELGVLFRNSTISEIKFSAQRAGLNCEVIEDRGFLGSFYQIKVSGPREKCQSYRTQLKHWLDQQASY